MVVRKRRVRYVRSRKLSCVSPPPNHRPVHYAARRSYCIRVRASECRRNVLTNIRAHSSLSCMAAKCSAVLPCLPPWPMSIRSLNLHITCSTATRFSSTAKCRAACFLSFNALVSAPLETNVTFNRPSAGEIVRSRTLPTIVFAFVYVRRRPNPI